MAPGIAVLGCGRTAAFGVTVALGAGFLASVAAGAAVASGFLVSAGCFLASAGCFLASLVAGFFSSSVVFFVFAAAGLAGSFESGLSVAGA